MNSIEAIRIALQSLWANKLRSVLTLLGVVIGVAAVIAVVTFVEGINTYVAEKIFNLGADVFIIFKVSPALTNVDHYLEAEKRKDLLMEDYQTVRDACRHCVYVGAAVRNNSGHIKYAEQSITDTTVQGITPSMAPIYDTDLTAGRMLNETDLNNKSPVIVVGTDIVEHLMTGSDPLGKEVRLDGWTYQVIGVGKKKGKTMGQSQDNYVMIPITAYLKQYGVHNQNIRISGKAASAGPPLNVAIDEARAALRASRHDRPEADDSFDIETNASLLGVWADFSSTFFIASHHRRNDYLADRHAFRHQIVGSRSGIDGGGQCGSVLWSLSRTQSCKIGSDCRPALRDVEKNEPEKNEQLRNRGNCVIWKA